MAKNVGKNDENGPKIGQNGQMSTVLRIQIFIHYVFFKLSYWFRHFEKKPEAQTV